MINVIGIGGKHTDVDKIIFLQFETIKEAISFIQEHDRPTDKYYRKYEIVEPNHSYEVYGTNYGSEDAYIYDEGEVENPDL